MKLDTEVVNYNLKLWIYSFPNNLNMENTTVSFSFLNKCK